MKDINSRNLSELDEKGVYEAFGVEGNEELALSDSYLELYNLLGTEAMLKLYKNYRGDKIDCPMKLFRADYVASLAEKTSDKRQRAQIARAAGYALKFIESILQKRKKENTSAESKD